MKALVVKNIGIEGPGTLGAFLIKNGFELVTIEPDKGQEFPQDPKEFSLVLILGGPMNVYEEDKYPFLIQELSFIKKCLSAGTKVLGICLGAQIIARALDAKVTKNDKKEIGWFDIELTEDGKRSPLFAGLPEQLKVFHWHGDTFDIPNGASRLAHSGLCRNQAFVYESGHESAVALQYHVEIESAEEIATWCDMYKEEVANELGPDGKENLIRETASNATVLAPVADRFYGNLLDWIKQ